MICTIPGRPLSPPARAARQSWSTPMAGVGRQVEVAGNLADMVAIRLGGDAGHAQEDGGGRLAGDARLRLGRGDGAVDILLRHLHAHVVDVGRAALAHGQQLAVETQQGGACARAAAVDADYEG